MYVGYQHNLRANIQQLKKEVDQPEKKAGSIIDYKKIEMEMRENLQIPFFKNIDVMQNMAKDGE